MAEYVVIREATAGLIEDEMNLWHSKGYELAVFVVDPQPLHLFVAVMQLKKPTRISPLEAVSG